MVVVSVGTLLWADDGVGTGKPQKEGRGTELSRRWPQGWAALPASLERQPSGNWPPEWESSGEKNALDARGPAFTSLSLSLPFHEMGGLGDTLPFHSAERGDPQTPRPRTALLSLGPSSLHSGANQGCRAQRMLSSPTPN